LTLALHGGALTNFPCKLRLKYFYPPSGAGAPTAPPGYDYGCFVILK